MQVTEPFTQEVKLPPKAPPQLEPNGGDQPPRIIQRLYTLREIIGDRKADPPIAPIILISRAHFYDLRKRGILPQGEKADGKRFYREDDVKLMIEIMLSGGSKSPKVPGCISAPRPLIGSDPVCHIKPHDVEPAEACPNGCLSSAC